MKRPPLCGCCSPSNVRAITIKGIDKTDGTTIWEYGPGAHWRHHYGADAISGVVPNLNAELDKYAIGARPHPSFALCGNRNTATLDANCAEALTITKLNSLDGTVEESATLTGVFCDTIADTFVGMMNGLSITNAAALSGGDYVIVGERLPFIEFVDFSSNTATKTYILHAHGQQAGNVYLKTRTSSETITIPQNATASEVESLFEATSDCVAATATGGPWPLLPITIEVEWSISGGDIAAISAADTYTASGGGFDWTWNIENVTEDIDQLIVTFSSILVGSSFDFAFQSGATFSYTSTTSDVATFLTALAAAMEAFAIAQGADGVWESVASGLPDSISTTGNSITIQYSTAIGIHPLDVTYEGGAVILEDSRRAGSCAAAYDTGTGDMTSAVGYNFGYSEDRPTLRMFDDGDTNPTVTGLNVLGVLSIGSGPTNSVIVTPSLRGSGDGTKANVVERWDISGGLWAFNWQTYRNGDTSIPLIIPVESGHFVCSVAYENFAVDGPTTAGIVDVSDASVTPYLSDEVSTSATNNDSSSAALLYDGSTSAVLTFEYSQTLNGTGSISSRQFNFEGSETDCNGTALLLGGEAFGSDGTQVYATSTGAQNTIQVVQPTTYTPSGVAAQWSWRFYTPAQARNGGTTQFRFRFSGNAFVPDVVTSWLDWDATASEIATAILAQFGENSAGGASNAQAWPFGEPSNIDNAYVSQLEKNLFIIFRSYNDPGSDPYGFIDARYINETAVTTVEMQTVEAFADPPGISAYDATDASLIWSRAWGTKGAATISQPQFAWLRGDFVYAYGSIVDNER